MNKRLFFLLMAFIGLALQPATAQQKWDLQKCVDRAMEHNLTIKQASNAVAFQDIEKNQSLHNRYPNLNAGSNLNWNFGRSIDPVTNAFNTETFFSNNWSLSSNATLYNGGRIKNNIKKSKLDYEASLLNLNQTKKDVALSVALSFLNVLFAQEQLKIVENQLALSQEQLKQMDRLIEVGTRPANDRLNIIADISRNQQNLISNENAVQTNLLSLGQLLRLDAEEDMTIVAPDGDIEITSDPDVLTFSDVYEKALLTQLDIQAGEIDAESAAVSTTIAKSGKLPVLAAGASLGTNYSNRGIKLDGSEDIFIDQEIIIGGIPQTIRVAQNVPIFSDNPYFNQIEENLSYGVGANLSIPIYNNNINNNNIERAKLNLINVEITNDLRRDQLKTEVQQALADARTAKKQLAASKKTVEALQGAYANAEKRFNLGAMNTYEFIDAKNQLDNAQVNLVISKFDYLFRSKVIDFYMGFPIQLN